MSKNNILQKIIFMIFISFLILILRTERVYAATANIVTSATGEVNKSMTISVSGEAAQWNIKLIVDRKRNSI